MPRMLVTHPATQSKASSPASFGNCSDSLTSTAGRGDRRSEAFNLLETRPAPPRSPLSAPSSLSPASLPSSNAPLGLFGDQIRQGWAEMSKGVRAVAPEVGRQRSGKIETENWGPCELGAAGTHERGRLVSGASLVFQRDEQGRRHRGVPLARTDTKKKAGVQAGGRRQGSAPVRPPAVGSQARETVELWKRA
jgi:hypothetical protein